MAAPGSQLFFQTVNEWIAVGVSFFALAVSALTAWLTLFQRGRLRMTQPTVVFFGPDGGARPDERRRLKVFLRTLLYSTSRRGQTIESLHVNLQRGESRQNFSIWVYGDDRLTRGSGLFIPKEGVACNHRFLLPEDGTGFAFLAGDYVLRVYAKEVDGIAPIELAMIRLRISESHAQELEDENAGIYFDWGPDQQSYQAHVEKQRSKSLPALLFEGAG